MDYFQDLHFRPERPPSELSEIVATAWASKQRQTDVTTRTYDHMSHYPRPLHNRDAHDSLLHPRTMLTMFTGFKKWLMLPCASLVESQDLRLNCLRSVDNILAAASPHEKVWSQKASTAGCLPWSGQDVLKLIILTIRCGNEMHPILNSTAPASTPKVVGLQGDSIQ